MPDKTIKKVSAASSPTGAMGQKYLASGVRVAMRLWQNESPSETSTARKRDYEIVGYALQGRAVLELEGQKLLLEPGDCWVIPQGSRHSFSILEPFTAVEATSPPARSAQTMGLK